MPVKIRLSRHGKKQSPYYHIVIADSRAPRDGKFIERIGNYDPTTNPATIKLNFDRALSWLQDGAQPTDTCRAILSYEGVLYKNHLLEGVKKGAFDEATAETRFESWKSEKMAKIQAKKDLLLNESNLDKKKRLQAESKVKSERAEAIAARNAKFIEDEKAKHAASVEQAEIPEQTEETPPTDTEENTSTEE
jgi:small subunit ribosomal protein S16